MNNFKSFDVVGFLQKLISIPSCDPPGGELKVATTVHNHLEKLGISSELDEFLPGRANILGRVPGRGENNRWYFRHIWIRFPKADSHGHSRPSRVTSLMVVYGGAGRPI